MSAKILIIDDDRTIQEVVSQTLKKNGFQTIQAKNGREGIICVRENAVDLILLDRNMPEIDGVTVLKTLKKHQQTMNIPVIMLTGDTNMQNVSESLTLGAKDYIVKPVDPVNLIARVRKALEGN